MRRLFVCCAFVACNDVLSHRRGELVPRTDASDSFADPSAWSLVDTKFSTPFAGAAFRAPYVYTASSESGTALRVDSITEEIRAFDVTSIEPRCRGFLGGVVAGPYVYLVPHSNGTALSLVARVDTNGDFTSPSSWSIYDLSALDASARGFSGGLFDGTYLYFVPSFNFGGRDGSVVRYDTRTSFGDVGSWRMFDLQSVDPYARGYFGAAFDGKHLYFVPHDFGEPSGVVARLDTALDFLDPRAWTTFDIGTIDPRAKGFAGAAFDGRWILLAPIAETGVVARFDSTRPFDDPGAWVFRDISNVATAGFSGAEFDGRHVYFPPRAPRIGKLQVLRFDTLAEFSDDASWSTFDILAVAPTAQGYAGGAFDGRFVYFAPQMDGKFLRLQTEMHSIPPHASFF